MKLEPNSKFDIIDQLLKAIANNDLYHRKTAARKLAEVSDPQAIEYILGELHKLDADTKFVVLNAISRFKHDQVIEVLLDGLNDDDSIIWQLSARLLGEHKEKRAIDALLKALEDHRAEVRQTAIHALVQIGDVVLNDLINKFNAHDCKYRAEIAEILGAIGNPVAIKFLLPALSDNDPRVRRRVVLSLGHINDPATNHNLLILAKNETSAMVRESIATALGMLKQMASVETLIKLVDDEDELVRESAIQALGEIQAENSIPKLTSIFWDMELSEALRRKAAQALGKLGDQGVAVLMDAAKSENNDTRIHAVEDLFEAKNTKTIPTLIDAFEEDKNSDVRYIAVRALAEIGDTDILPLFRKKLNKDNHLTSWGESVSNGIREAIDHLESLA